MNIDKIVSNAITIGIAAVVVEIVSYIFGLKGALGMSKYIEISMIDTVSQGIILVLNAICIYPFAKLFTEKIAKDVIRRRIKSKESFDSISDNIKNMNISQNLKSSLLKEAYSLTNNINEKSN